MSDVQETVYENISNHSLRVREAYDLLVGDLLDDSGTMQFPSDTLEEIEGLLARTCELLQDAEQDARAIRAER